MDRTFEGLGDNASPNSRRSRKRKTNKLSELYGPDVPLNLKHLRKKSSDIKGNTGSVRYAGKHKRSGGIMTGTLNFDTHKQSFGDLRESKWAAQSKRDVSNKAISKRSIHFDRKLMLETVKNSVERLNIPPSFQTQNAIQQEDRKDRSPLVPPLSIGKIGLNVESPSNSPKMSPKDSPTHSPRGFEFGSPANSPRPTVGGVTPSRKPEQNTIQESNSKWLKFVKMVESLYGSVFFTAFFASVILLSMFMRDIWIMILNVKQDSYSDITIMGLFVFFIFESILNSVISKQYRFSFVFLLDTISTFSLILDITEMPFVSKENYSNLRSTIVFNLLKLLSVLKLWRATRLFFRKNQTKTLLRIDEKTMKMMKKKAHVSNSMQQVLLLKKKTMGLKAGGRPPAVDTFTDMVYQKSKFSGEKGFQLAIKPSPSQNKPDREVSKFEVEEADPLKQSHILEKTNKHTPSGSFNKGAFDKEAEFQYHQVPKSSEREGLENNLASAVKEFPDLKDAPSNLDVDSKLENSVNNSKVYLMKSTVKNMSTEINQFNKEKERFIINQQEKEFILKNKMEAAGNIRKTIAYRNVSTIACTVLMTNLGLSIFVSNIFSSPDPLCLFDARNIVDLLKVPENRNSAMIDTVFKMYSDKYKSIEYYDIMQLTVTDLYNFVDPDIDLLREDEKVECMEEFDTGSKTYRISIILKNRALEFYSSLFNILRTIFIAIILIINIILNNNDIKDLAMDPIERIFEEVTSVH